MGEGEFDATPEEMAKEFGDSELADFAAAEAEKADPGERKNQPLGHAKAGVPGAIPSPPGPS